jgi:hypothetical protein
VNDENNNSDKRTQKKRKRRKDQLRFIGIGIGIGIGMTYSDHENEMNERQNPIQRNERQQSPSICGSALNLKIKTNFYVG